MYLYKKTYKYYNCSQCKNYTRTLQEVVCIEKNRWKHKFVNNVTVNYVTTILLNSKYLSKCINPLKKLFVFNQSKSAPVNKDQFKSYNSCHLIFTRVNLYALGT